MIPKIDRARCSKTLRNGEQCKNKVRLGDLDFCTRHKPFSALDIAYDSWSVQGQNVTIGATARKPNFCFEAANSSDLYTLAMYDPDAPVARAKGDQYLHWLIVNIGDAQDAQDVIQDYMGPAPPPNSGVHHYIFSLFRQNGEIDPKEARAKYADRTNFDIDRFIRKYGLDSVEKQFFTVSS